MPSLAHAIAQAARDPSHPQRAEYLLWRAVEGLGTDTAHEHWAARRALFTVFAVRSAVGRLPRERAKPRASAGRSQATPSDARRLSSLVKCPLSDTEPRPATLGT